MTTWHSYMKSGAAAPEWPYPIRYDTVTELDTDVLVLGGGIAGCHAAINAAREGARVIIADKGPIKRSGMGGAGVDHWLEACSNPHSKVTPTQWAERAYQYTSGYCNGPARYITAKESWDALLDCEQMGVQIRDEDDEFAGASFRDKDSKLLFAYDYENRHHLRVWGNKMKPCLYDELKRLNVTLLERTMITSLLNQDGVKGARVVGATGVNNRTGEFYTVTAKAVITASSSPSRIWCFSPEQTGGGGDLLEFNASCDGHAAGWQAGAEFVGMEFTMPMLAGTGYIPYGTGNANNTWHGASIVDSNGKEVPWGDCSGRELSTAEERFHPGAGEGFILSSGTMLDNATESTTPGPLDLPRRVMNNEVTLPLYADLTLLPEKERRAIFGLMVGNEGKSRIPVYDKYTKAGFDPDKDMLQVPVLTAQNYGFSCYWLGNVVPDFMRNVKCGGLLTDWNLRTNVEGLYAAGMCIYGNGPHSFAAATGRYAGRKAAHYALQAPAARIDRQQVERERERCYAPINRTNEGLGWKELNVAITRVMLDYCGMTKTESVMKTGLGILKDLKETEIAQASASNPHELMRVLECSSIVTASEIVLNACLARKASSAVMMFQRYDYPAMDPTDSFKWYPVRQNDDEVSVRELPLNFHLEAPYAPTYEENYALHAENKELAP